MKKKKIILVGFFLTLFSNVFFAQIGAVRVHYTEEGKNTMFKNYEAKNVLLHNKDKSVYIKGATVLSVNVDRKGSEKTKKTTSLPAQYFFKNYLEGTLFIQIDYGNKGTETFRRKLGEKKWEFVDETKVIDGVLCKKAIYSNKKEGTVVAWYTDEIGIVGGPGVYDGLPGLIMYLEDSYLIYKVAKITFLKKPLKLPKRDKDTKMVESK